MSEWKVAVVLQSCGRPHQICDGKDFGFFVEHLNSEEIKWIGKCTVKLTLVSVRCRIVL